MLRRLALLVSSLCACAAANAVAGGPKPDQDAMREAMNASGPPDRYTSSRAYHHYLGALLLRERDDHAGAAEELRQALVYDPDSPHLHVVLAQEQAQLGQFERAEAEAQAALGLDPQHGPAHLLLGKLYAARGLVKDATRELKATLRWAPREAEGYRVLLRLALTESDPATAEQVVDGLGSAAAAAAADARNAALRQPADDEDPEAVELAAGDAEVVANLLREQEAQALGELGRYDGQHAGQETRAERYLRAAVDRDPTDPDLRMSLAQFYEAHKRKKDATHEYERALASRPDMPEVLATLARLSAEEGHLADARAYFAQAASLEPSDADGKRDLAQALMRFSLAFVQSHDAEDALKALARARELTPESLEVAYYSGVALEEAARWTEAAAAFGRLRRSPPLVPAVGAAPADTEALLVDATLHEGACLSRAGRHADALKLLGEAVAAHPARAGAASQLALAYEQAGRAADGVTVFERLASRTGGVGCVEAEISLSELYEKAGRAADGLALLKRATEATPRDVRLLYALGGTLDRAGHPDAAIETMRAILVIEPDHAGAMNFIGYTFAEKGQRLEEAELLLRRAVALRPDDGLIADSLGFLLLKRGDLPQALELLERAVRLSPDEPVIAEHLGDGYERAGRRADAVEAFRRGLDALGEAPDPKVRAELEQRLKRISRSANAP